MQNADADRPLIIGLTKSRRRPIIIDKNQPALQYPDPSINHGVLIYNGGHIRRVFAYPSTLGSYVEPTYNNDIQPTIKIRSNNGLRSNNGRDPIRFHYFTDYYKAKKENVELDRALPIERNGFMQGETRVTTNRVFEITIESVRDRVPSDRWDLPWSVTQTLGSPISSIFRTISNSATPTSTQSVPPSPCAGMPIEGAPENRHLKQAVVCVVLKN
jgi:hypothetical protein